MTHERLPGLRKARIRLPYMYSGRPSFSSTPAEMIDLWLLACYHTTPCIAGFAQDKYRPIIRPDGITGMEFVMRPY